jgi:hypothetical protein
MYSGLRLRSGRAPIDPSDLPYPGGSQRPHLGRFASGGVLSSEANHRGRPAPAKRIAACRGAAVSLTLYSAVIHIPGRILWMGEG